MKKRVYSVLVAGMLCVCTLFSSFVPAHAQEASAHAECEHNWPPLIIEIDNGYDANSAKHWKKYSTVARCKSCGTTLEVISQRTGPEEDHDFKGVACKICFYGK